jgi:hypothetical protein
MKTSDNEPSAQEIELVKVKVLKAKHLEQLTINWEAAVSIILEEDLLLLGYVSGSDRVLARRRSNQHLFAFPASAYYDAKPIVAIFVVDI